MRYPGSLEAVLAGIPGLAGWTAQDQQNRQRERGDLQQFGSLQSILAHMQAKQQQEQMRGAMSESGGDPEKALEIALKSGNVDAANKLTPLVKMKHEQRMKEEAAQGMRDLNAPAPPQPMGAPQDLKLMPAADGVTPPPAAPVDPRQQRVAHLQKMMELYASHPAVVQRIQTQIDKLSTTAKSERRTYQKGEESITEEQQADGSWKELGRGPKFSRQVAPAININAPSKEALSEEAIRDLAIQSLYDSNVLAGYRRDTTAMSRIGNARIRLMKEAGITSEDVVGGRAGFKADTVSLNKITPQYDAITAFEKTAIRNGKILIELADKADTTGVPAIERWIRSGRKAVAGDTDVAKFDAQMNLYRAEAARILTQPNLSGVLTDTARKEMEHVLSGGASAKQVREVVGLLERDFNNRKETLEEQIGNIRTRMRGRVGPGAAEPIQAPAPAVAPPAAPKRLKFDAQGNPVK